MKQTQVSVDSATFPLAVWSFMANRMVDAHVRNAYAWGELLRRQAKSVTDVSGRMGKGTVGDAFSAWGRMQELAAEIITDAASRWGRRYGHLAFAVPVPSIRK